MRLAVSLPSSKRATMAGSVGRTKHQRQVNPAV